MDHRADFDERDLSDIESLKEFLDEETYQYVLDSLKEDEEAFEKATNEYERTQDQLFVIDGAEVKFNSHKGEFKVLNDTPSIQGKLVGTMIEKTPMNFTFSDGFQLLTLGEWQDEGTAKFQNRLALIKKSKIQVTGQMPGSTTIESGFIEFETSGQKDNPDSLDFTGTPLSFFKPKPKIINGRWTSDKNTANEITQAALEETVYFVIETAHIADGEKLSVQLYDYDYFMWIDLWNLDDKIENPKAVKVKNNRAVIEVYLKPEWKKHIDQDKDQPFANESIELYWEVSHEKAKTKILPANKNEYLKVRNDRNIYIKPVMSESGYNYGVPEIYAFDGSPMFFTEISELIELPEKEQQSQVMTILKDEAKSQLQEIITNKIEEKSTQKQKYISLAKLAIRKEQNKYYSYVKYLEEMNFSPYYNRAIDGKNLSIEVAEELAIKLRRGETPPMFKKKAFEPKLHKAKALYVLKENAGKFGEFFDLVSFAKDGDISSAQMAVLSMLLKTNFLGDIMMNLTLNIMQKPMREIMVEGLERDKRELDIMKFKKFSQFRQELSEYVFLRDIYKLESISYQSMQGLLEGTIKRWRDLEYANEEVSLLYKYIEKEDVFIIDAFFINTKDSKL